MKRLAWIVAAGVLAASAAGAQVAMPPDEARTIGAQVPDVTLIAEDSTTFQLSTLAGKPVIVSPIFTACPHTCARITDSLREALAKIGEPGVGYQVLTLSFDPADGPAQLREYRERLSLPAGWTLAVATPENLSALLDAIDFNYLTLPEGGFAHANVITILSPTLEVSGYVHGVMYDAKDIRNRLEAAANEASLIRHYRPIILLIGVTGMAVTLFVLFSTRKKKPAAQQA
jgi:cytochrome oxidase Cu insertion factor (SCO1/SenC/PrrC family)